MERQGWVTMGSDAMLRTLGSILQAVGIMEEL